MVLNSIKVNGKNISWILRCPTKEDALEMSQLRVKIDGETENLDREAGEDFIAPSDFEKLILVDEESPNSLFIVAEVMGKIVGFARCKGNSLNRFRHKAEFGICILQDYCGFGIGNSILKHMLSWADCIGIKKISLSVVEINKNAIQLYKKYGFKEEGFLVKDRRHLDGNYYNTIIMGRLADEE